MTDDLVDRLAGDVKPVRPAALAVRIIAGLAIGLLLAAVLLVLWLGVRADLASALATPVFWVKFAYPLLLASAGLFATERLARPGLTARGAATFVGALFALSVVLGVVQLLSSPPGEARRLILGGSALVCPFYIVALSAPVLVAIILVLRSLAPTRPTAAGLAAGLLAGAAGAWVYSFYCRENGLAFLAIWYTLGIAISAAAGALLGRYALRW